MAKRSRLILLALFLLGGLALWASQKPARAENTHQGIEAASGLDVVFLLDQSGSMANTDPQNRRIETLKYILDYLFFDNTLVDETRRNRAAVIEFGDLAEVLLPFTDLKNAEVVEAAKNRLRARNMSGAEGTAGETDVEEALKLARRLLSPETDGFTKQKGGLRSRLIVLLTDGVPQFACQGAETPSYVFMFDKCIYPAYAAFDGTAPLYVIGFNIINETDRGWQMVEPLWLNIARFARRVDSVNEINKVLVEQLCLETNNADARGCRLQDMGYHFIPPYARAVTFSFFKYQPNTTIQLFGPDGKLDQTSTRQSSSSRDELYVANYPAFGCWRSDRIGQGKVDVFTQIILNSLSLVEPRVAHPRALPLNLKLELKDDQGQMVDEYPELPIEFEAYLINQEGVSQTVSIRKTEVGLYANDTPIYLGQAGDYTLMVSAWVNIPPQINCQSDTTRLQVFRNSYQIPVYEPDVLVLQSQPHLQYRPVSDLVLGFVNANGELLPLPENMPRTLQVEARAPSGAILPLPEAVRQANNTFRIAQPFVLPETGEYAIVARVLDSTGQAVFSDEGTFAQAVNIKVKTPGSTWPLGLPVNQVDVQLLDLQNQPVAGDLAYPLTLKASWQGSGPEIYETWLTEVVTGSGRYTATAMDWDAQEAAPYQMQIEGFITDASGAQTQVLAFTLPVRASETLPYFVVREPLAGSEYNLYWGVLPIFDTQPVGVELVLVNQPQVMADLLRDDPNRTVTVSVVGPDGLTLVPNQPLTLDSSGKRLQANLEGLNVPGTYTMTVYVANTPRTGESVEGAWLPITVSFTRVVPWWVSAIWALTLLILAGVAGFFSWQLADNYLLQPRLRGQLIFETGPQAPPLATVNLAQYGRNRVRIPGRQINPSLNIDYIFVRRVDAGDQGKKPAAPGAANVDNTTVEVTVWMKPAQASSYTPPASTTPAPTPAASKPAQAKSLEIPGKKIRMKNAHSSSLMRGYDNKQFQIRYDQ